MTTSWDGKRYSHEIFSSVAQYKDNAQVKPPINHLSHCDKNRLRTPPNPPQPGMSSPRTEHGLYLNCKHCLKARKTTRDVEGLRVFWKCSLGYTGSAMSRVGNPTECLDFKESIARPLPSDKEDLE